ncbi:MAG: alcohol dehydrogenase [Ilumatobacter coccineus]|uniref:Alcohol dehydrogenase n=1 Tax=Ilumatobacter coccineus TaxID=467094 RepID=A0A2G6K720_9ACTN|nr:MAG: alcohol dehydrogenase [Ilumatobacter coccineus]
MSRQCSKTGCSSPADVTLTYDYAHAMVWLDELTGERDPHAYDLCERHAGRLTVPQGWQMRNRRRPLAVLLAG